MFGFVDEWSSTGQGVVFKGEKRNDIKGDGLRRERNGWAEVESGLCVLDVLPARGLGLAVDLEDHATTSLGGSLDFFTVG